MFGVLSVARCGRALRLGERAGTTRDAQCDTRYHDCSKRSAGRVHGGPLVHFNSNSLVVTAVRDTPDRVK
jgi:hypothetical protein